MKYISYTFIDEATQLPVSQEPARKGPIMPEGVEYVFSIEESFSTGVPSFFGIVDDEFLIQDWMREYSKEDFISTFKYELRKRASLKKKFTLSQGSVEEMGVVFSYSKSTLDGLYSVINTMILDHGISEVDFETDYDWVKLNLAQARETLVTLNKKIQEVFSWCCNIHKDIEDCSSIEDALLIQESIAQYVG
jgi:uncharacterized protein YfcZ (UPF0381/DUF406 family)